jgi:hypothetical protein
MTVLRIISGFVAFHVIIIPGIQDKIEMSKPPSIRGGNTK